MRANWSTTLGVGGAPVEYHSFLTTRTTRKLWRIVNDFGEGRRMMEDAVLRLLMDQMSKPREQERTREHEQQTLLLQQCPFLL